MKKLLLVFLAAAALSAQTVRENLQRTVGTNVITGTQAQVPLQVSLVANLRAVDVSKVGNGQVVAILGYLAVGDGGGGQFIYDATSTATDNGTTIIQPGVGSGRWLRISYINLVTGGSGVPGGSNGDIQYNYLGAFGGIAASQISVTSSGSTTASTLATRFAQVVSVKDYGAVGNGVADDTAAINAAAAVGGRLNFGEGNTYLVSAAVTPVSGAYWYGHSAIKASGTFSGTYPAGVVVATSVSNFTLDGLEINANYAGGAQVFAVVLTGGSRNTVRNCYIHDTYQAGVWDINETYDLVDHNYVLNCGRLGPTDNHGIVFLALSAGTSAHNTASFNTVENAYRKGIGTYCPDNTCTVNDIKYLGNTVIAAGLNGLQSSSLGVTSPILNAIVEGNSTIGCYNDVEFSNQNGMVLSGNTFSANTTSPQSVLLSGVINGVVSNNQINNAHQHAIYVTQFTSGGTINNSANVISGNTIHNPNRADSGFGAGIYLANATYTTLAGNVLTDDDSYMSHGIYSTASDYNVIGVNSISGVHSGTTANYINVSGANTTVLGRYRNYLPGATGIGAAALSTTALALPASTASVSPLNVPHGTAPTSPVNGDVWSTTAGFYARVNGSTVGLFSSPSGSDTQIQYNNAGSFGANTGLTFISGTATLVPTHLAATGDSYFGASQIATGGAINVGIFGGDTTGNNSTFAVGQSAANNLGVVWIANTTAASGYGLLATYGYSNPLTLGGSQLNLYATGVVQFQAPATFDTAAHQRTTKGSLNLTVNVKDYGATGDGTTADQVAIDAAIAALTSHGTLYFPAGKYRITAAMSDLSSLSYVTIEGSGAEIYNDSGASGANSFVINASCSNITIRNLAFTGTASVRASGIHIRLAADYSTISNCTFQGCSDFAVLVSGGSGGYVTGVKVINCTSISTLGDGFHFGSAKDCMISDSMAISTGDDGLGIVSDYTSYPPTRINVSNFKAYQAGNVAGGGTHGCGIRIAEAADVNVTGSSSVEGAECGLAIDRYTSTTYYNTRISVTGFTSYHDAAYASGSRVGEGIDVRFGNYVSLKGCTVDSPTRVTTDGIGLLDCNNLTITGCDIHSPGLRGIGTDDGATSNVGATWSGWFIAGNSVDGTCSNESIYVVPEASFTIPNVIISENHENISGSYRSIWTDYLATSAKIVNNTRLGSRSGPADGGHGVTPTIAQNQ